MNEPKAIRSGFRGVLTHPLAFAAEVASHWTASLAASAITFYALFSFLHSLPVSDEDAFLLRGVLPGYTSQALKHIFTGSGPKLVFLLLIVSISTGILRWIATAAGRSAVLPIVLGSLPEEKNGVEKMNSVPNTAALFRLHALRVALTFTTILANLGVLALAEAKSRVPIIEMNETRGAFIHDMSVFFGVIFVLGFIVMLASSVLDWYLELSPIVADLHGTGVRDSFRIAAELAQRRTRQFSSVSFTYGVMHWSFNAFLAFFLFLSINLIVQLSLPLRWTFLASLLAIWSVVQRFLGLSRLVALGRIIVWDDESASYAQLPVNLKKMEIGEHHPLLEPPVVPAM